MFPWLDKIRAQVARALERLRLSTALVRKRRCPECGAEVSASARTCFMCGQALPAPKRRKLRTGTLTSAWGIIARDRGKRTCPHCGALVSRRATICSACEQPLPQPSRASSGAGGRAIGHSPTSAWASAPSSLVEAQAEIQVERRRRVRRCPTCSARVREDADLCPMCGTDLNLAALEWAARIAGRQDVESEAVPLDQVEVDADAQTGLDVGELELQEPGTGTARRVCARCGTPVARTAKRCTICGAEIAAPATILAVPSARRRVRGVWIWAVVGVLIVAATAAAGRAYWIGRPTRVPTSTPTRVSSAATQTRTPTATVTHMPTPTPKPVWATLVPTQTPTITPTSTSTPTPTATPTPIVHVVQPGETLYSIARYYGISVAALSQANDLSTMSMLHPDDKLVIPAQGQMPTATVPATETMHTVQEGERLSDIAQRYAASEERIREANDLEAGAAIHPGDRLVIPLDLPPTLTATRAPTRTPTPGLPYPAPHLLYPVQNAQFKGAAQVVTLQWTSVGILAEDEWYALSLRYLGSRADGQPSEITVYTRITSWRVPGQWYPGEEAPEHRFEWTVQAVRRPDIEKPPTAISPPGEVRRFQWQ